jgi:hypothetical protein
VGSHVGELLQVTKVVQSPMACVFDAWYAKVNGFVGLGIIALSEDPHGLGP